MRDVQFYGVTLCMSANAVAYSTFRTQLLYLDDESPTKAGVKHHNISLIFERAVLELFKTTP